MTLVTAVFAELILVVAQSTVESGEFTKLIPLVIVLTLGGGSGGFNDLVDEFDAFLDGSFVVGGDDAVHLFLVFVGVHFSFACLDGAFATDRDLGTTLAFHGLERVSSWPDEQAEEFDFGELFDG